MDILPIEVREDRVKLSLSIANLLDQRAAITCQTQSSQGNHAVVLIDALSGEAINPVALIDAQTGQTNRRLTLVKRLHDNQFLSRPRRHNA